MLEGGQMEVRGGGRGRESGIDIEKEKREKKRE